MEVNDKIRWCLQKEHGIEIVEPNENLVRAYLSKAERALAVMENERGTWSGRFRLRTM